MYPEYDPNEPTLGQTWANMLRGFQNPQQWQEAGQGIVNTAKVIPNVVESLGRGGVAQAIGTMGDLRDLRNTAQSYLPKSVQNFSNAAEFLTNPYAKALIQTAPTTESTLDFVPRATAPYEGYKQHETLGEYIAPSLGYFGGKALKAGKDLPIGLSIEDVTPPPAKVAEALRQPQKNELGFYSPLEEAVGNLQNPKGTGQQYLAQLLKTQGVKQEEVATRGLDTFLESNPKVSREQIAQYLRENPVELKETVLGADTPRQSNEMTYEDYRLGEGQPIDDSEYIRSRADDIVYDYEANNPDVVQLMRENSMEELGFTPKDLENPYNEAKFQQYVENRIYDDALEQAKSEYWDNPYSEYNDELGYRVVGNNDVGYHITDPNGRVLDYRNGIYDIDEVESAIRDDAVEQGLLHYGDDEYGTKYHDYTLPNGENYKEVLIQYPQKPELVKEMSNGQGWMAQGSEGSEPIYGKTREEAISRWQDSRHAKNYQSGHFDEPNILAHIRTTDRTIDGKKTLFVEEIQSDWHQAGRKKGYDTPEAKATMQKRVDELEAEREQLYTEQARLEKLAEPFTSQGKDAPSDILDKWNVVSNRLNNLSREWSSAKNVLATGGNFVPDVPFKKNWQELAMKRAMQMAAEGGYDRVAFTTGKQQADRYSLSKQISKVVYDDNISGGVGNAIMEGDPSQGKLIAYDKNGNVVIDKFLHKADDLEDYIGKEASKKLLEQQAKQTRSGSSGVRRRELSGVDLDVGGEGMKGFYDKILPDFINKYGKKHGLKVGKTKVNVKGGKPTDYADFEAYQKANKGEGEEVHYFDLTPEAKESFIKKGQPMFAVAPAMAITDEDSRREVLEKLFNSKK